MRWSSFSKRVKRTLILGTFFLSLGVGLVSFSSTSYFEVAKNLDIYATLFKELNTYYVDEVEPSKLMRTSIDAMLESLDPYTNYISEADIEGYRLQTTGKYGGIGSLIRNTDEHVLVAEPYEGYPADKAGLMAGDRILYIGEENIKGMNTEEVSKLLKGQAGTTIELKIERLQADGSYKGMDVTVEREEIKIPNVPYSGTVSDGIAYIRLSNFTEQAGKEVRDAFNDIRSSDPNIKGVIFDLRGNPGGLLNEAVNVTNVFIDRGQEVVSTKGKIKEWDKSFKTLNPAVDTEIPLVVLINGGSASASEIVSGSIQDLDRGVVVGQKSFGKGLVQTTRSLTYNTKLKVTTAKYYVPSGRCIQAINYAERDEDGSLSKVPDSLKTAFQTTSGRMVYDGGGIDPDITTETQRLSKVSISLLSNNHIFDYATVYRSKNPTIGSSTQFHLTDEDFNNFVVFLSGKKYEYSTRSETLVKKLKETAKKEKYLEDVQEEIEALETSMAHDKKKDVQKHKKEIIELLEEEIIGRYHYRKGQIEATFDNDKDIIAAIKVLNTPVDYKALLVPSEE